MAGVSQIYEADEILHRVTAAARATIFFLAYVTTLLLASCGSNSSQPTYDAAIQEGQTAAQDLINQGSSAVAIALVGDKRIIWSQRFGLADRDTGQMPTDSTMFGIGSVSKMFATIAVMQLVDRGVVDLDTPLVTYLPTFRMAAPEYKKITVRMLLNHSSGFPGCDYRNLMTRSPVPGYLDQVLQTLSMSRLKAPPGYMSVYCNDGFTITAALVEAMSGKSYVQFVQDEILTPLGMTNTRYPLSAFPTGSYAKAYVKGAAKPQEFVNTFASGGAYSTADDMARIAMMFLNGGRVGTTRILSSAALAAMAKDQTIGSFNPIHSDFLAYGLGWDSVSQPGLKAVGFDGWAKGGDSLDYHAALVVSPQAQLGIVVLTDSGASSQAIAVAERVLLRALYQNRRIAAFPSPLLPIVPPVARVPDGLLAGIAGEYAQGNMIWQLQPKPDGSLLVSLRSETGWTPNGSPLKYRSDGWFASDQDPLKAFKVVDVDLLGVPTQYILNRGPGGYGHYLDYIVLAQRVRRKPGDLSAAWRARLSSTWLVVNENPSDELAWNGLDPRLRLVTVPNLEGLIAVRPPAEVQAPAAAGYMEAHIADASGSDTVATMMLIIPQLNGRDLDDLDIVQRDGAEWIRFGSYMHQPLASVPVLPRGTTKAVNIGPEGYAEWRAVASDATPVQITITTIGAWHLYDPEFKTVASGKGNAATSLPAGKALGYLTLFGDAGQTITVAVQ
jgi:CubicO group peptidase (beta-lactamase class C family)